MNESKVKELLNDLEEPFLKRPLREVNGVIEVQWKEDKQHIGVKLAIVKTGTKEQLDLQTKVVGLLKELGAASVGIRFTELPKEIVEQFQVESPEKKGVLAKLEKTTFIAVASGKGGVGKSTISVNLAVAFARLGKKVGLIDADIYGFSIPDIMGINERPTLRDDKVIPVEKYGVKVISTGFFVEDNMPIIWRGPMLGKMLNNFFDEVEWGDLDYLILDLPPGTGDIALDVHALLPACKEIIVTTPHPAAAFVAARSGAMAIRTKHEILGVIENMSYFENKATGEKEYVFGKGGGKKLAEVLQAPLLGQLPLVAPTMEEGEFVESVYEPTHPLASVYKDISETIFRHVEKK